MGIETAIPYSNKMDLFFELPRAVWELKLSTREKPELIAPV